MFTTRIIRYAVLFSALALFFAQAFATALMVNRAKEAQLTASMDALNKIGRSTEASINRSFVQVDAMLAGLPAVLAPFQREGRLEVALVNRVLREFNNQNFTYRDILLIGENGLPVATALPVSRRRRLPLPDSSSFAEVASRGGSLSIGGPVLNPSTGEWTLFFARNITLSGLGPVLAVAEVPIPVVQNILSGAGESQGLTVTLERDDGTLLASVPHDETRIGHKFSLAGDALRNAAQLKIIKNRFSEDKVLAVVRPSLYPALIITVTLEVDKALSGWYSDRIRAYLVSAALGLMLFLVAGALMIGLRQRERVEDERSRARRTLENALESMSDGFVMFDPDDRLIACNSRYKDFYKISAPFIVPGALFDDIMREGALRGQYPQARGDIEKFVVDSKAFHRGNHPPMERLLPDGRWVLITERRTPDGGTVGIRTDITPLKNAMQELADARDIARAAGEAKTQFLARMSHELRTPLNGILGFSEILMEDRKLGQDQKAKVRIVHSAGSHLLELVNGLLDLSKIESGHMALINRPFELHEIIQNCASFMTPELEKKDIEFTFKFDNGLPKVVSGDPTRLRQIILNLLSNAVKFTPPEGRIEFCAILARRERMRIEVKDTGPGISPENQRLIFEDFVQLASSYHYEGLGTGLGLAITSRLVKQMGGEIGCESAAGKGALFWLEIPLDRAENAEYAAYAKVIERASSYQPRQQKILVVDDVRANREIVGTMLAQSGHEVLFAENGAEALKAMQCNLVDVVLMDLQMPEMDGLTAARAIRQMPAPAGLVPIIALTASVMPEQIDAAHQAGMDAHIGKPIHKDALLAMLSEISLRAEDKKQGDEQEATPVSKATDDVIIELNVLVELKNDLKEASTEVIQQFVEELNEGCKLLEDQISRPELHPDEMALTIHRLLGAARTLGTKRLTASLEKWREQRQSKFSQGHTALEVATINVIEQVKLAVEMIGQSLVKIQ